MITVERAVALVRSHARRLPSMRVALPRALGAVLAAPVKARDPLPRFDASAVDGFAVLARDVASASQSDPVRLSLVGVVRAGDAPGTVLTKGRAVKVFTGAPLPEGT